MSYLEIRGPDNEHSSLCQKVTRRIWEGLEGGWRCQSVFPMNLPESFSMLHILAERCTHHQEGPWVRLDLSQVRWLARDNLETNPITIKPKTASRMAEQFPGSPGLHRAPLPNNAFCFVGTCVSLDNSFPNVRWEPTPGPRRDIPLSATHTYGHVGTLFYVQFFCEPKTALKNKILIKKTHMCAFFGKQ